MRTLALILACAALAAAQKPLKKHRPYIANSPGPLPNPGVGAGVAASPQAYQAAAPQAVRHHGGFSGSQNFAAGLGQGVGKQAYPLLLSDTRTLNSDGTINFNYQADNGLHQGETVDSDGTRRGFYSYPGADGKLITVKYTAGKNGFVAEGDHLPTQPQSAPYNPNHEDLYSSKQVSHGGSHHGGAHHGGSHHGGSHHGGHSGAYRPSAGAGAGHYSHSSGGGGIGAGAFADFPGFSNHHTGHGSGAGRHHAAPAHTPAHAPHHGGHQGGHHGGHHGGSGSFSSLHGLGGHGGGASLANIGHSTHSYGGPMFTVNNPYQPHTTGPVNAGFDLGNGGHFAINFAPGVGQEYNPSSISGDYSPSHGGAGHGGQGRH